MTIVASGIDALYLSARGDVDERFWTAARSLREEAQADDGAATVRIGSEEFGVAAFGFGKYPIRLEHEFGLVGVTDSRRLPSLRFQPVARVLHAIGPEETVSWFRETFASVVGRLELTVSRLDLFVDFQGHVPVASDERAFVTRAKEIDVHIHDGVLTGFSIGKRKSGLTARLYDKTAEIAKDPHSYWHARVCRGFG